MEKNKLVFISSSDSDSREEEYKNLKKVRDEFESRAETKSGYYDVNQFTTIKEEEKTEQKEEEQLIFDGIGKRRADHDIFFDFSFDMMKNYKFYFKHNNPEILISAKYKRNPRRRKSCRSLLGRAIRSTVPGRKMKYSSNKEIN